MDGQETRAAGGERRGSVTAVRPGAAGQARADVKSTEAIWLRSAALAQRLEQVTADVRATIAQIQQGRPQREILRESVMARLRARLDTMPVIEQAKGIIVAQSHCRPDEAFDLLRRTSQRLNLPVRELAAQIVATMCQGPGKAGQGGGKAPSASPAPRAAHARLTRWRAGTEVLAREVVRAPMSSRGVSPGARM